MKLNHFICILALAATSLVPLAVQAADSVDGVTLHSNKVYSLRGDKQEILEDNLNLPFKVEVSTNGSFTVEEGKIRMLQEGQVLRSDGWLLNPDGSIQPVFDHVAMKNGKVYVVRDGQAAVITETMVFPNGMSVNPDGYRGGGSYGGQSRLQDGQLFRLDGTAVAAKDTVTLKNGRVVVQKDGHMITLQPVQIMGMSDGTRVRGTGLVEKHDGTSIQLREGKTILIDGAYYGRQPSSY